MSFVYHQSMDPLDIPTLEGHVVAIRLFWLTCLVLLL
jgi:hypothetical protein